MRVPVGLMIVAAMMAGCMVSNSSNSSSSRETLNGVAGPFKDVTLVDADISIVPPATEARFPYHLDKVAAESQLSMRWSGAATSTGVQGAGACRGPGAQGVVGGANSNEQGCGRLEPGDAALVITASGGMTGHVKLAAKEQV